MGKTREWEAQIFYLMRQVFGKSRERDEADFSAKMNETIIFFEDLYTGTSPPPTYLG